MEENIRKFHPNEPGTVAGIVYLVLGAINIQGGVSVAGMENTIQHMGTQGKAMTAQHTIGIWSGYVFVLLGIVLLLVGAYHLKLIHDFHKIKNYVGSRELISISEMAQKMHKKEITMRRQLRRMIQSNLFLQGHMNREATCFLLTDEAYRQYLDAVVLWEKQQQEWEKLGFEQEERILLEKVQPFQSKISKAVGQENNETVRVYLERIEASVGRLLKAASQNPTNLSSLHTFLNYFLPTADKLIGQYQELPKEPTEMKNIKSMQTEIPQALETLADAFEKLTAQLCEQLELNITSNLYAVRIVMEQHRRLGVVS